MEVVFGLVGLVGMVVYAAIGIAAFKYLKYGDTSEPMSPALYIVAVIVGGMLMPFAVLKWMFRARI